MPHRVSPLSQRRHLAFEGVQIAPHQSALGAGLALLSQGATRVVLNSQLNFQRSSSLRAELLGRRSLADALLTLTTLVSKRLRAVSLSPSTIVLDVVPTIPHCIGAVASFSVLVPAASEHQAQGIRFLWDWPITVFSQPQQLNSQRSNRSKKNPLRCCYTLSGSSMGFPGESLVLVT